MPLCALCDALSITKLYPPNIYHHGEHLAAVKLSGQSCQLCKLIHWSISRANEGETRPQLSFEGAVQEVTPYGEHKERDRCSVKLQIVVEAWDEHRETNLPTNEIKHVGIWMRSKYMVADITLAVEEGDGLGVKALDVDGIDKFITNRVLTSAQPSDAYFDVARRWLGQCISTHSSCEGDASYLPELPARVIDVACDGQIPRLIDGAGKHARYATLSHCWGGTSTIKTELESLRLRQEGIPVETLPKTFADAIVMCRKIGIRYLWIDSLCIIQDDKGDWEYHSSVMGSIFYNSTLTLAASSASNSSVGLFVPAKPNYNYPWLGIIALPSSFSDRRGQVYVKGPSWDVIRSPVSDIQIGVLQSRGWVMQEKALSLRSLHFMKGQMAWECSKCILNQDGFSDEASQTDDDVRGPLKTLDRAFAGSYIVVDDKEDFETVGFELGHLQKDRVPHHVDIRRPTPRNDKPSQVIDVDTDPALYIFFEMATRATIHYFWYHIISAYSPRRLTFSFDKLPAVAGVASRISAITTDDYLAGHWRTELERSLFWITETESAAGHPGRGKNYRAPSWSWASVDGMVGWMFPDLASEATTPAPLEILEASVEVEGTNSFGCVTGGRITIKAHILRANWDADVGGWRLVGMSTAYGDTPTHALTCFGSDNSAAGYWEYDDLINGILPGPSLTKDTSMAEVHKRSVPRGYFGNVHASNLAIHGEDAKDNSTLWKRGTYVPEELILVKGAMKHMSEQEQDWFGHEQEVHVLVLARTEGTENEYRRVGVGKTGSWDETAVCVEVLTVV